ncbi:hypothetical protein BALAC2494_01970 [Bifidobacterium animalis subsp. lactis CNCM I-2494]|uniref:Uncharacterized protein n=1 Tax=Bifidobacterium animalis subsp. lactis CNCM I-2494 TaxID=1042403 RepID=A0A806FIR0_BIFAN|nr:hypothetical protein BALAC2494_01970 [Bifidobacterium animalis subsp. lactis CNCM I-2494]
MPPRNTDTTATSCSAPTSRASPKWRTRWSRRASSKRPGAPSASSLRKKGQISSLICPFLRSEGGEGGVQSHNRGAVQSATNANPSLRKKRQIHRITCPKLRRKGAVRRRRAVHRK